MAVAAINCGMLAFTGNFFCDMVSRFGVEVNLFPMLWGKGTLSNINEIVVLMQRLYQLLLVTSHPLPNRPVVMHDATHLRMFA